MRLDRIIGNLQKTASELEGSQPSWKHRRRLIYGAVILGALMILAGMTSPAWDPMGWDRQVASELIIGGVALISIIVSAYVGGAAYQDTRLWQAPPHTDYDENPE